MTTLELEADKARLAHAILSIDNASVLAAVKKQLSDVLNLNIPAKNKTRHSRAISKAVQDMVIGEMPDNFNADKETDNMWEELAK